MASSDSPPQDSAPDATRLTPGGAAAAAEQPAEGQSPRWRRLPEERPRQLIDAAFEVFSDQGLEGARLDEIARRAGVSKGTIYLYFASKEELFRAVVEAKVISVIEAAEQDAQRRASEELSGADDLRRYMTMQWDHLRSRTYLAMYRLVHSELHHFPDLMRFYGNEVVERSLRLTASIIGRGIARGEFVDADPLVTARLVASMLLTHALWYERRTLYDSSMNDCADTVRDSVIEFALRSLIPAPGAAKPLPHPNA